MTPLLTLFLLLAAQAPQPASPKPATAPSPSRAKAESATPLEELVALMTGSFSSAAQHAEDKENYFDIRLHMTPIWPEHSSNQKGYWLYVEQAVAAAPERPYRQRIYRVFAETASSPSGAPEQLYKSEVYLLPGTPQDVLKFAGAWQDPTKLNAVAPDALTLKDGCTVVLRRTGDSQFDGATVGNTCPSERSGAKYATAEVRVNKDGLQT